MLKKPILLLAVAALLFALAPTAQAYVDFVGDASSLLNLSSGEVLAAVNFWDPDRVSDGQRSMVGSPIQGVNFDDFAVDVDDTGSPFALSSGVAGATLSTIISQSDGREFSATLPGPATNQTQIGTFTPQNADNIAAELLAQGGAYYQDKRASDLTFAFGAAWADTAVEVQMLGGGIWNKEPEDPYMGVLTFSVGGVDLGHVEDQGYNMQLSTFETTTDENGDLLIDLTLTGDRYCILAGAIVTALPAAGLEWDGGTGIWTDENWNDGQAVAADMDMIINAETDPDDAEIIIGPSNVTVNADFVDDNGTGPGTGDGPAASVFVGEVGDDTFGAKLTIASAVTLEVTGESTAGEFGTIAIDNEAVLKTDSAIIEPDGNLVAGVQGDKNGLLQSAGQLSLEEIVDDGSGDVVAGGADGIQIDWLPLEGGTPEEGQASMFGGTYTIAEYTGTALTTEGVTSNENANIGTGYIKSVDYDVDLGDGILGVNVELQPQGLGDTDLDADVDGDDLATFGLAWAPSGTDKTWFDGDFDFDGDIDGDDLAALGLAWAPSGIDFPAGDLEVTAVPEPGSIIMLLIGAAGLLIYRKRR